MTVYLDASVLLPTLIEEVGSAAVDRYLEACSDEIVISEFASAEVASALSRLVRTKTLDRDDAAARLADFEAWRATATADFDLQASDIRLANIFVRRFDLMLRAPDALHAAACRRSDFLLLTLDRRLSLAATELGVRNTLLST